MISIMFEDVGPLLTSIPRRELGFEPGQTIFRQGGPVRRMFFVTSGAIHLVRHQMSGAPLILQRAEAGSMLAEASLYSAKYHCDATAVVQASAWTISKLELLDCIARNPDLGMAFIKRLARELQDARFRAEILSMKTVAARLSAWIEWSGRMPPKGGWVDLAAELSVSPEALYRELARRRF